MKKIVLIGVVILATSAAMASYTTFIGSNDNSAAPSGGLVDNSNWDGGTMPSGSSTGLVHTTAGAVWTGVHYDLAVRQTGGYVTGGGGNMTLRGGTSGSGITTVYEIEDARTDYASYTNLNITGTLTFWSQYQENMEVSLLSGHAEFGNLTLNSAGRGSVNIRDGILHAGSMDNAQVTFNMLTGGTGVVVIDSLDTGSLGNFYLNFETGNAGSFTFGSANEINPAANNISWMIDNGHVSIDGVADTDLASYSVVNDGLSSTIALIPEPATLGLISLVGVGMLAIRRFMVL